MSCIAVSGPVQCNQGDNGESRLQKWWQLARLVELKVNFLLNVLTKSCYLYVRFQYHEEITPIIFQQCFGHAHKSEMRLYSFSKIIFNSSIVIFYNHLVMSSPSSAVLNGRFEVTDTETNKSGVLQVCMDGISLFLDKTKVGICLSLHLNSLLYYVCWLLCVVIGTWKLNYQDDRTISKEIICNSILQAACK